MSKRLADLDPKLWGSLDDGVLRFDCPAGKPHKIVVHIHRKPYAEVKGARYWQVVDGEFPGTLTLHPSINEQHCDPETGDVVHQCWHGHIVSGSAR